MLYPFNSINDEIKTILNKACLPLLTALRTKKF